MMGIGLPQEDDEDETAEEARVPLANSAEPAHAVSYTTAVKEISELLFQMQRAKYSPERAVETPAAARFKTFLRSAGFTVWQAVKMEMPRSMHGYVDQFALQAKTKFGRQ
jgi:hypothetical protein